MLIKFHLDLGIQLSGYHGYFIECPVFDLGLNLCMWTLPVIFIYILFLFIFCGHCD